MDRRWAYAVLVACVAGCGGASGGGADLSAAVDGGTTTFCTDPVVPDGGIAATFTNVQRLFSDQCLACHFGGTEVDLSPGHAWASLVNQPPLDAREACGGVLVEPGDPAASYLYVKLSSDTPCFGMRMPLGELGPTPLADCEVDLVRRWILAGAPND